jgi:hypothetical protein
MDWFSPRRDGFVLLVLALLLVLLGAGITGAYRVFGYTFVALVGLFTGLGFRRRGRWVTMVPPILASAVLAIGMTGIFLNESAAIQTVDDTRLGFHPATAFLVYAIWMPAFLTLGVSFAVLFEAVAGQTAPDSIAPAPGAGDDPR